MPLSIQGFVTRDDFLSRSNEISPIFELSPLARSYSESVKTFYSSTDSRYSLMVFSEIETNAIEQSVANDIISVITSLTNYLTDSFASSKQQNIITFTRDFNLDFNKDLTGLSYNNTISHLGVTSVDYLTFDISGVHCDIWLSDASFKAFYPGYSVRVVLPFDNFSSAVNQTAVFLDLLDGFKVTDFNAKLEADKGGNPTTYTKIIDIPYVLPNSGVVKSCYFGFNIYGAQGNFDYVLKLVLFNELTVKLGMDQLLVQQLFPTMLNINEFYIVPRWDNMAIPVRIGQYGINSQMVKAYPSTFDNDNYIKIFNDRTFIKDNTYNLPVEYNNMLLQVTNGYYTEAPVKDFKGYYSDYISVSSVDPDFARMSSDTQQFNVMLNELLYISDSDNATEMFSKLMGYVKYKLSIVNRAGVSYLSLFYREHQYYIVPKFEYYRILNTGV